MNKFLENIKNIIENLQKNETNYDTMNLSFEDYISYVTSLARLKSSLTFHNKGANHAKVVLSNIFALSKKTIFWYSGCLDKNVLDNSILSAILDFIHINGKIELVLEEIDNNRTHLQLWEILKRYNEAGLVKIYFTKKQFKFQNKKAHFLVGDASMYRIEKDTSNFEADFCFYDPDMAQLLKNEFSKLIYPALP